MAALVIAAANVGTSPRGADAMVLGDRSRPADASTSRCLHGLWHATILATADATDNGGEHIHHRPDLHRPTTRSLCGCLVVAGSSLRNLVPVRGDFTELALSRLVFSGQAMIEREVTAALASKGLQGAAHLSLPMPFTTLRWRVVVLTSNGFLESERSLIADRTPLNFRSYASDHAALQKVSALPPVQRLNWFTHGFLKAEQHDGRLVLSDLRMGAEPDYIFRYVVAAADQKGNWRPIPVERLDWAFADRSRLGRIWQRIWNKPDPKASRIDG